MVIHSLMMILKTITDDHDTIVDTVKLCDMLNTLYNSLPKKTWCYISHLQLWSLKNVDAV